MFHHHILQVSTPTEFTVHSGEHSHEMCTRIRSTFRRVFFRSVNIFDVRGIIHHKFVEPGTTMNTLCYETVLQKVKKAMKKKRGSDHQWILHRDNVPSHHSFIVQQYLAKKAVTVIPYLPYSPDRSPCDFFFISAIQVDNESETVPSNSRNLTRDRKRTMQNYTCRFSML